MFNKRSRPARWVAGWLALIVVAQGCSAPAISSSQPTLPPTVTVAMDVAATNAAKQTASAGSFNSSQTPLAPAVTAGPTAAAFVPATPTPTATGMPVTTPLPNGSAAEFDGISFSFDPSVGGVALARAVPSDPVDSGMAMWPVAAHTEFTFPDYPVPRPTRILVFPVSAWHNYNPESETETRIPALQKLLADKPAAIGQAEQIPLLPRINAGQIIHARVGYLSFQNGSGVRFITQYDQGPEPINNSGVFYTFQGLTSDGQYYVSAFFDITHPSLPADNSDPQAIEAIGSDFDGYINQTTQSLDAQPPGSFNPPLGNLDAIIQSLKVK